MDHSDIVLVTGATGLVGSHVAQRARGMGIRTRALVRASADASLLDRWGVETIIGDITDAASLAPAVRDATIIVHCAAKVGDWGPIDDYRAVNVKGLANLLASAEKAGTRKRLIHISSLGVYEARNHYGTDETEPPCASGIDGYTATKVEAEQLILDHVARHRLPATILRPGFIYGPRDRTVLPRILERLQSGSFKFLGSGETLLNNTFVENLVDACFAAVARPESVGQIYNITDGRLVTKCEFISTIARQAGLEVPTKSVPLGVARVLANVLEALWRLTGRKQAPVLSRARIKFLGLNLDFCIGKARRELGYAPRVDFTDGMQRTIDWFAGQEATVRMSPAAASPRLLRRAG